MSDATERCHSWNEWLTQEVMSVAVRKPKPTFTGRGAIAAILDEVAERVAIIRADTELAPEAKRLLLKAIFLRAQGELSELAGVAAADQPFLAEALVEVAGATLEAGLARSEKPRRFFWDRVLH